jgi:hypothetical protein
MPTAVGLFTLTVIKVTAGARAATVLVKVTAAAAAAAAAVRKAVARRVGNVSQAKSVVRVLAKNTLFSVALINSSWNNICGGRETLKTGFVVVLIKLCPNQYTIDSYLTCP